MNKLAHNVAHRVAMLILAATVLAVTSASTRADVLFESGTLGPTGISLADLENGSVPGTNVNSFVFPGVRFELTQPVVTTQIGGHFINRSDGTFFGAIVGLAGGNDFPDSVDLSTPDVVGKAILAFPNPSAEAFGNLALSLDPGWYALVFGSGLFGTSGSGGAVRNGIDIGDPSYISFDPNLGWFNFDIFGTYFDNHRFVVKGTIVPEPSALNTALLLLIVIFCLRLK